jgi:hypothetical protein
MAQCRGKSKSGGVCGNLLYRCGGCGAVGCMVTGCTNCGTTNPGAWQCKQCGGHKSERA